MKKSSNEGYGPGRCCFDGYVLTDNRNGQLPMYVISFLNTAVIWVNRMRVMDV